MQQVDETDGATVPRTADAVAAAAAAHGFVVPEACMAGVLDNLALLAGHADTLLGDPPA